MIKKILCVIILLVVIIKISTCQIEKLKATSDTNEYLKIKDRFIYAHCRANDYELWTSDEYFALTDEEFIKKNESLQNGARFGCTAMRIIDEYTIVKSGYGRILYINMRNKELLRQVQMPYTTAIDFDIYEDKDLIFIFDGDVYIYDYESDSIKKQENITIKEFISSHEDSARTFRRLVYSKKHNILLYQGIESSKDIYSQRKVFAINLTTNRIIELGLGFRVQNDEYGELYYSYKNIIYKYYPEENKGRKFFTHKKTIFEYDDTIVDFRILDDVIFVFFEGAPNFKGIRSEKLVIYTDKKRIKIDFIIFTDNGRAKEKRYPFFEVEMDIGRRNKNKTKCE